MHKMFSRLLYNTHIKYSIKETPYHTIIINNENDKFKIIQLSLTNNNNNNNDLYSIRKKCSYKVHTINDII